MNENKNNKWWKLAEWRGYVLRALEDIGKDLTEIKDNASKREIKMDDKLTKVEMKVDEVNKRLNMFEIKLAGLAASVAFITYLVIHYLVPSLLSIGV